jgi:hypothetical protein
MQQRRFKDKPKFSKGKMFKFDDDHPVIKEKRTRYPKRVEVPREGKNVLVSGFHNKKIGKIITKGRWKGMPIYTLTLEERKTCPDYCPVYNECYGNKMTWATRWEYGLKLEKKLSRELESLNEKHKNGFVVRLHVLGDFYSGLYIYFWYSWLIAFENLRVFGYTAHRKDTLYGASLKLVRNRFRDRFVIRFPDEINIIDDEDSNVEGSIVCPAQTERTECCATCALCWQTDKPISFIIH